MYQHKKINSSLYFFSENQELLISLLVALLCLFLGKEFPTQNSAQDITKNLFFLIIFPAIYIRFILNKKLANFGLNLKNQATAIFWGGGLFIFSLLAFYFLIQFTNFHSGYVLLPGIISNFWAFLVYELLIINFIVFINEFFFRGFLLFLFREKFQSWAIAIQVGIYLLVIYLTDSLSWQTAPFILFSVTGGILAYKTKSFLYSYFVNIFAIIFLHTYLIYLSK